MERKMTVTTVNIKGDDEFCLNCKHFTIKILLNGYDGVCDAEDRLLDFKKLGWWCEKYERMENE